MIDYSFFFFNFLEKIEAQQQTQPYKPLATPSQAHWLRADNRHTTNAHTLTLRCDSGLNTRKWDKCL